jgi:hypothetical protein
MENLFNGLQEVNGEVKATSLKKGISCEFWGEFNLSRGSFSQKFNYYARLQRSALGGNYVVIEETETDASNKTSLGNIVIDDIESFKKTLINSGLQTLARSLNFTEEEKLKVVASEIIGNKLFKAIYGKNAILIESLSEIEKQKAYLKYCIENFENLDEHSSYLRRLGFSTKSEVSIEILKEKLDSLK